MAWSLLKAPLGEGNFSQPLATDMGPAKTGPSDIDLARRGPRGPKKFPTNPKVPSNQREDKDSTYDFSMAGEHPLRGEEGFPTGEEDNGATIDDPKLRTVSQEEFDADEDSLDTSTPSNPFKLKSYALEMAWSLLKADPAAQMVDSMGRRTGMGTIHPAIMSMLARQGREGLSEDLMSAQGPGGLETGDVSLPMENLRDVRQRFGEDSQFVDEVVHEDSGLGASKDGNNFFTPTSDQEFFDTGVVASADEQRVTPAHFKGGEVTPGPEEGFLTPSQAFMSNPELVANLRRNVGGQQMGERMRGLRHQTGGQTGVARGAELRNRNQVVEPEAPPPKLSPEQQLQQRLQAMAESSGMDFKSSIDMTPQNATPMEIPMEIQNKIRDVPNYGMNEAAAELGVDPAELRRGMKALPGFRSGPSARKLEYDRVAANLPEDMGFADREADMPFNENKGAHSGDTRGYLQPTGGYADLKQGQDELAAMGIGDEDSMYSQLMGMGGELSPEANAAALARLGLSPTDIDAATVDARAAEAKKPTPDLRSMRGMGDKDAEDLSDDKVLGESMGMIQSANIQPPKSKRFRGGQGNLYPKPDPKTGKTRL